MSRNAHKMILPNKDKLIYPVRPLISLSIVLVMACLYLTDIFSLQRAIYWGAIGILDDVIFMPFMRLDKALRNRRHGRKSLKTWVSLTGISLGLLLGAVGGFFAAAKLSIVVSFVPLITEALGSNLVSFMLACIFGYFLITRFNEWATGAKSTVTPEERDQLKSREKFKEQGMSALRSLGRLCPDFVGIMLGAKVAEYLPAFGGTVGMTMDVVVVSAVLSGFIMALLTKWLPQFYYKVRYGHSNADGYDYAVVEGAVTTQTKDEKILDAINKALTPAAKLQLRSVTRLRQQLIRMPQAIKRESHWMEDLWTITTGKTSTFKNTLHALLSLDGSDTALSKELETPEKRILNFKAILRCLTENPVLDSTPSTVLADPVTPLPATWTDVFSAKIMSLAGYEVYSRYKSDISSDVDEATLDQNLKFYSRTKSGETLCDPLDVGHLQRLSQPFHALECPH